VNLIINRGLNILNILRLLIQRNFVFLWFVAALALNLLAFLCWIPPVKAENTDSTIQLINTGNTQTIMDTNFYDTEGVYTTFRRDTVNAKGTVSISLSGYLGLSAGQYTGQSISEPNKAAGLVYGPGANRYGKGLDAYPVESDPSSTACLPIVVRNLDGLNTMIRVMNTSEAAQNVDIFFYQSDGTLVSPTAYSTTVPGNATWSVNLEREGAAIGIDDDFSGSARINGTDILAVVAQLYTDDASSAYLAPLSSEAGTKGLASSLYFPWVRRGTSGLTTKLYFRNIGTSSSNLLVSIRKLDGSLSAEEFLVLPNNGLSSIDLSSLTGLPDGEYSIETSSDQPTEAVALLQDNSKAMCAYSFSPTRIAMNLYVPFVKMGDGWSTSINIKNVSAMDLSFNYSFRNPEGSAVESGSVENFSPLVTVSLTPNLGTFEGAGTVEATNPISGVVLVKSPDGDFFSYPATTEQGLGRLVMPHLIKNKSAVVKKISAPAINLLLLGD